MTKLLVGTAAGAYLLDDEPQVLLADRRIDWVHPAESGWWLLSDGDTLWYQPDRGTAELALQLPEESLHCLLAFDDELLIGSARARLFRGRLGPGRAGPSVAGPVVDDSFEQAPGRSRWYTPWGGPPDVRSLARDVDGTVYVNVHVGGIVRQRAGENSWDETLDIDADVHQVVAHPTRAGVVVAATANGLAVSTDAGDSWEFRTEGMHPEYCRAVAVYDDTVFISASGGPGGTLASLFRTTLSGTRLERCVTGLPEWFSSNLDTGCLAANSDVVIAGDSAGLAYRSTDRGETWREAGPRLPAIRAVGLR